MADKLHDLDDEKLKKMEKKISAIYNRAGKEVKATADDFLKQFDKEDKKRAKEVLEGKETHDNYIAWREEQILRSKKYKKMQENIALQLSHTNETAVAYVNGEMPPIYIANYNDLSNVVDGIGGYSFDLIDQNVLNELINENPTLLPERELDIPKDLKWNRKKIQSELLQGIIQGEPMDKIAKRMGRVTDMNKHSAIRNARTSVTNVENKGRMDSYIKAEKDGIILDKEWIATAGKRTRDSHAKLDGTIIPYDQKFDNGLMYPADPNGRPEEVWNCRCTMGAVVRGFKQRMQVKDDLTEQTVVNNGVAQKVLTREQAITQKQKDSAEWYVSGEGQWINQYLRNPSQFTLNDSEKEYLKNLDVLTKSQTVKDKTLYRSVDAKAIFGNMSQLQYEDFYEELLYGDATNNKWVKNTIGKEITEKGFMSTTKSKEVAGGWGSFTGSEMPITLELETPQGIKGFDMKDFEVKDDPQYEVLLSKNQKYKIKDVRKEKITFEDEDGKWDEYVIYVVAKLLK